MSLRAHKSWRCCLWAFAAVAATAGCQTPRDHVQQQLRADVAARNEAKARAAARYRAGLEAYDRTDYELAARLFQEATGLDPSHAPAWVALGETAFRADDFARAAEAFQQATRAAPMRYEPYYNLGVVLQATGRYRQAIKVYETALDLGPQNLYALENLAFCYIAVGEHLDRARDLVERALPLEDRPYWRVWLNRQAQLVVEPGGRAARTPTPERAATSQPTSQPESAGGNAP